MKNIDQHEKKRLELLKKTQDLFQNPNRTPGDMRTLMDEWVEFEKEEREIYGGQAEN